MQDEDDAASESGSGLRSIPASSGQQEAGVESAAGQQGQQSPRVSVQGVGPSGSQPLRAVASGPAVAPAAQPPPVPAPAAPTPPRGADAAGLPGGPLNDALMRGGDFTKGNNTTAVPADHFIYGPAWPLRNEWGIQGYQAVQMGAIPGELPWLQGNVTRLQYWIGFNRQPEAAKDLARYQPWYQAAGLLFAKFLKLMDKAVMDSKAIVESSYPTATQEQKDQILATRRAAMDVDHTKTVVMIVDALGQMWGTPGPGQGCDAHYGLGCMHHGLCSHRSACCHANQAGKEVVPEHQVPLAPNPQWRRQFDATHMFSGVSLAMIGVVCVTHVHMQRKALKALKLAYGTIGQDPEWCEQQLLILKQLVWFNDKAELSLGESAQRLHALVRAINYPLTEPIAARESNEEAKAIHAAAEQQEEARVAGILSSSSSSQQPSGNGGDAEAGPGSTMQGEARLSVFHPERLQFDQPPWQQQACPQDIWGSVIMAANVVRLIACSKGWPSAVFAYRQQVGMPDVAYLVPSMGLSSIATAEAIADHGERFLGLLDDGCLVRGGQVVVNLRQYMAHGVMQ